MFKRLLKAFAIGFIGLLIVFLILSVFKPKHLYHDQVAVLMYHHVDDHDKSMNTVSTKLFREQLSYLKSSGYHFITLDEMERFFHGAPLPENAVLVTFDDGYQSFFTNAYPILTELHIPAVNFVITHTLDAPTNDAPPKMSKEQIKSITSGAQQIDLQCHTDSLHSKNASGQPLLTGRLIVNGTMETDQQYNQRIIDDTNNCTTKLKHLTTKTVDALAYPYGAYNESAAYAIAQAGVKYAFTVLPKMTTRDTDPMKIPRINAGSPYVTPIGLHNAIMRRITSAEPPYDQVALRDTVEQIGGELTANDDGSTEIRYNGEAWRIRPDSTIIEHNNQTFEIAKPMRVKGNRSFIALTDLEKIVGVHIYFNSETQTFTAKLPTKSETDTETKELGTKQMGTMQMGTKESR